MTPVAANGYGSRTVPHDRSTTPVQAPSPGALRLSAKIQEPKRLHLRNCYGDIRPAMWQRFRRDLIAAFRKGPVRMPEPQVSPLYRLDRAGGRLPDGRPDAPLEPGRHPWWSKL